MANKTLSISEDAYNGLVKLKNKGESFSQLIMRITSTRGTSELILEFLESFSEDNDLEDLADNIETVYLERKSRKLRKVEW